MPIVLTGSDLTIDGVVAVARTGERVALDTVATARMTAARAIVDRALERGDEVYGLNTGVGVLKRIGVRPDPEALASFNVALVRAHRVSGGPDAPPDVARATMVCLANTLAMGAAGVRPLLVEHVLDRLNDGSVPRMRVLGSIGQADLAALADLVLEVVGDLPLAPGEALALVDNNAFSVAWASLALADARRLIEAMEAAGALSLEAFGANLTMIHPVTDAIRPYPGLAASRARLATYLDGSHLFTSGAARHLQDPLSFRNVPQILGATRDALGYAELQVTVELNASQGNPVVVEQEQRVVSVANFEVLPVAMALDLARIALATAVSSASERAVKLLESFWSGLPTGLTGAVERADAGLSMLGIAVQSFAAEARLLAQPVSFELVSTAHAEGIEDRMTMAPLAARRLADMVQLARLVVATELVVAAQAVDLRNSAPIGRGTRVVLAAVRERYPFLEDGDLAANDLEPVVELIRTGRL